MDDLIPLREAARLIPSHVPGKRVCLSTLYRWIFKGRLPAVRRGHYYFVRLEDVRRIAGGEPVQPAKEVVPDGYAERELRKLGIL